MEGNPFEPERLQTDLKLTDRWCPASNELLEQVRVALR